MKMKEVAFYDERSDKIYGCKKGSLEYYHEEGHRNMWKEGTAQILDYMRATILLPTSVIMLCFELNNFALLLMLIWVGSLTLEEISCWIYAYKRKKK